MWPRLASLVADRFVLAWLAGAAVWLGYLISLALGGWSHDAAGHRVGADHVQYYVAGKLVNEGEAALIYDAETMKARQKELGGEAWKGYLPFRYPPFYALAFAPTSRLPYEASFLVWTAIGLGCLLLSGRLLGVEWRTWLLWSLCFYPVFAALSFGQNGLISLAVLSGAAALWRRDRPFLAGLVLGLLAFKPHLALGVGFLWIFDARRSWRALLGIVVTTGVLVLIGYLTIPSAYAAYRAAAGGSVTMLEQGRAGLAPLYSSQGFWQLLLSRRLDPVANQFAVMTSLVGLLEFFLLWRGWLAHRTEAFALAVLATPWLTPYAMVYDWSILLVAAVLLAPRLAWGLNPLGGAGVAAAPGLGGRERTWGRSSGEQTGVSAPAGVAPAGPRPAARYEPSTSAEFALPPVRGDRWLALCALVWLVALVSGPLVRGQLWLTERFFEPVALQVAFPAIVLAVLALWNPDGGAVEQPPSVPS